MLGSGLLFYIVVVCLAAIYLLALWKATGRAIPEPPPKPPSVKSRRGLRRKFVFLALNLAAYGGPFVIAASGPYSGATLFWILCDFFLGLVFFFWGIANVSSHTLAAELEEFGIRSENFVKGGLQHIFLPNWIFHNPILTLVGIANVIAGIVLAINDWNLRLLAIAGYGVNFLAFLWLYGQLDEIRIWTDRIEFLSGCEKISWQFEGVRQEPMV